MHTVEIIRRPSADQQTALARFVAERSAELGAPALSDHLALDLAAGGATGFVAVTVSDDLGIAALAQISAANTASAMEVVVRSAADADRPVRDDVVETAVDSFRRSGAGMLAWWVDEPTASDRALALGLGLHAGRVLHEMRRPLPLDRRATVVTRSFVPGVDDLAWLEVNNRAFAAHGEQGGWTIDTLRTRIAEPWFDADGFRLYEHDARLAGFCWTKVHDDTDPVLGEIYVIGIDPDFHGRGLGRELTLAGLDALADQGVRMANLYVDADNIAAGRLYDRLGFGVHRSRQVFAGELTPIHEPEDA